MTNLTSDQLLKALVALMQSGVLNTALPKAKGGKYGSKSQKYPTFKGGSAAAKLTKKTKAGVTSDQPDKKLQFQSAVIKGFKAKGLKDTEIELYGTGTTGIQTYKGWLKLGRQVKKGQHGVKGCFHYSQTEPMAVTEGDLLKAVAEHRNQEQVPA